MVDRLIGIVVNRVSELQRWLVQWERSLHSPMGVESLLCLQRMDTVEGFVQRVQSVVAVNRVTGPSAPPAERSALLPKPLRCT